VALGRDPPLASCLAYCCFRCQNCDRNSPPPPCGGGKQRSRQVGGGSGSGSRVVRNSRKRKSPATGSTGGAVRLLIIVFCLHYLAPFCRNSMGRTLLAALARWLGGRNERPLVRARVWEQRQRRRGWTCLARLHCCGQQNQRQAVRRRLQASAGARLAPSQLARAGRRMRAVCLKTSALIEPPLPANSAGRTMT